MLPVNPNLVKTRYAKALKTLQAGKVAAAEKQFRDLLNLLPDSPEVHFQLSRIADLHGDQQMRLVHLEKALARKPKEKTLLEAAVDAASRLDRRDTTLTLYDRLAALDPKAVKPQADKAAYLQRIGAFDEAESLFRKLIDRNPYDGELYRTFLGTKKLPKGDPIIGRMRKALAHPRMSDGGKMHLNFALAKALEDQGQTDKVFAHLNRANALQRKLAPFDEAARDSEVSAMLEAQADDNRAPIDFDKAPAPIFVTGMPRSGTTLIEQIIAAHSTVTPGGEMGHALRLAMQMFPKGPAIEPLQTISEARLHDYAAAYTAAIRRDTSAVGGFVTDKSIQSYLVFGLLRRALPMARFVIVHRDPRDIALSMYKNHFQLGTHRYATDLAAIAATIKRFRNAVAFWRARHPDLLHEVSYDALVSDPEPQSRALLSAVGLPWEDACLDFHKARGSVKTLSLHQVRQPIYKASAQGWKKYESDLKPFFDAWGDDAWD